jgi:hypothetical protein
MEQKGMSPDITTTPSLSSNIRKWVYESFLYIFSGDLIFIKKSLLNIMIIKNSNWFLKIYDKRLIILKKRYYYPKELTWYKLNFYLS